MKELKYEDLPPVLTEDILLVLLEMAERQSPAWRDIFNKMTNAQSKQYADFQAQKQTQTGTERRKNMTQEEIDIEQLGVIKFWSSRWNDGNLNLFYEHEQIEKIRKGESPFYYSRSGTDIPLPIRQRLNNMTESEKFYYFSDCDHPFSNFYKTFFNVDGVEFHSVVQYMAYKKSELFLNRELSIQILKTSDPLEAFQLSKRIRHYDKRTWINMYSGNNLVASVKNKFIHNEYLKDILLSTRGNTIVLADEHDRTWGIGCGTYSNLAQKRDTWPGKNLLGEILTNLRVEITGNY